MRQDKVVTYRTRRAERWDLLHRREVEGLIGVEVELARHLRDAGRPVRRAGGHVPVGTGFHGRRVLFAGEGIGHHALDHHAMISARMGVERRGEIGWKASEGPVGALGLVAVDRGHLDHRIDVLVGQLPARPGDILVRVEVGPRVGGTARQ